MNKKHMIRKGVLMKESDWNALKAFMESNNINTKYSTFIREIILRIINNPGIYQLIINEGLLEIDVDDYNSKMAEDKMIEAVKEIFKVFNSNNLLVSNTDARQYEEGDKSVEE